MGSQQKDNVDTWRCQVCQRGRRKQNPRWQRRTRSGRRGNSFCLIRKIVFLFFSWYDAGTFSRPQIYFPFWYISGQENISTFTFNNCVKISFARKICRVKSTIRDFAVRPKKYWETSTQEICTGNLSILSSNQIMWDHMSKCFRSRNIVRAWSIWSLTLRNVKTKIFLIPRTK